MNKISLTIISNLIFLLGVYSQTNIQPKIYNCYRNVSEIVIDGNIYDSIWKSTAWSDFFNDIEHPTKPQPYLQTRMKMLWDKQYLYIAAEMEDDNIWASLDKHDQIIYHDNDFEVFIDPDGDGLNYFEIEINAFETVLDLFMNKPYNKGGISDLKWDAKGMKKAVQIYGKVNDTTISDTKWAVELAIPWEVFTYGNLSTSTPKNNDEWRINFSRVQWETEYNAGKYIKIIDPQNDNTLPENNWTWSSQGIINMHVPEYWGHVIFHDESAQISKHLYTDDGYPRFWVWKGGKSMTNFYWEKVFRILDDAGVKGLLYGGTASDLEQIIPIASQYNIDVHAWFWTMNRADAAPEWLSVNQQGYSLSEKEAYVGYYKFMCPALPEVQVFIKSKIDELTTVKGLSGIHLDYIRYVDVILPVGLQPKYGLTQDYNMPEYDYGYHPFMLNLYKEKYGINPLVIKDVGNNKQWINFRLEQLDTTVAILRTYIHKSNIPVSAAVFPSPQMASKMVRQNWKNWQLDCYFPMVYHNFYNEPISWIKKVMKEDRKEIGNKIKIFCGLYLPALKNNNDLEKAINAAIEGGANGVSLFSYAGLDNHTISQIKIFTQNPESRSFIKNKN